MIAKLVLKNPRLPRLAAVKVELYESGRGITAEVEIKKVKRIKWARAYPWANIFAPGTLRVFEKPIRLSRIHNIAGFEDFGKHRAAYRNITHEQYRQLRDEDTKPKNGRIRTSTRAANRA